MIPLKQLASLEAARAARTGRSFVLVRMDAAPASADELLRLVAANLRRTDHAQQVTETELVLLLVETHDARTVVERLEAQARLRLPELKLQVGWAAVGQKRSWQEAWAWAGALLVADAAKPAAA